MIARLFSATGNIFKWSAGGLFAVTGLALIVFKIAGSLDTEEMLDLFRSRTSIEPDQGINEFVLFSHRDSGDYIITTGVLFASNITQDIIKQWCYVRRKSSFSRIDKHLTLANTLADGEPIIPAYNTSVLRQFDLTSATHRKLVNSHCSFRTSGTARSKFWMPRVPRRKEAKA